jgi:hypothetical protein
MQTLNLGTYRATLSPLRNLGELQAKLAKCNGAHKRPCLKQDKRVYPFFYAGMSTADYVKAYAAGNDTDSSRGPNAKLSNFFGPLNEDPCTLYAGEDTHEEIEE